MCNSTGISESFSNPIVIFPNPANTELNIILPENDYAQIEISNALGQVIVNDQIKDKIDISSLTSGLYYITIQQGQQKYSQKLIKL